MNADDILNNTDPDELRNILRRLRISQDAGQRPPPTVIINQAPGLFPAQPADTTFDLGWTNVKDHGAVGDGANDDTNAITNAINALPATGGVLYFPPGSYLTSGGFTISVPCLVLGMGQARYDDASSAYISSILCTSATASLFTVSTIKCTFRDLTLVNTAGSTPSAGAGITVTGSDILQRVGYENVYVYGFYIDIDVQVGNAWTMHNCILHSPVLYALRVRNTVYPDAGDWSISDTIFATARTGSDTGIRIESSSGGKITNCKIQGTDAAKAFLYGIDLSPSTALTGTLLISNCSIENVRSHGIRATTSNTWHTIIINGVQFGLSWATGNSTGNAINIACTSVGLFNSVVIANCVFAGGASPAAISLTNVDNAKVLGNVNKNMGSLITQSGCTNLVIVEPGTAVTAETSYGQSSAVGSSTYYAREDHTHGSPSLSGATPQDVASAGAAGSGTTPNKNDHVHKGVHSLAKSGDTALYGDVTLSAGSGVTLTQAAQNIEIAASASGSASDTNHLHGLARWLSSGSTTFDLPDIAEYLESVSINGLEEDPTLYSLSSDRTQVVFDSATTAADIVTAQYVLAQV